LVDKWYIAISNQSFLEDNIVIRCPLCGWKADGKPRWKCSDCGTKWDTFSTNAECPTCGKVYEDTGCPGCHQKSLHADWYFEIPKPVPKSFLETLMFWKKRKGPPVTAEDKLWIEDSLLLISELFGVDYVKTLTTVTPTKEYFDRNFTGTEEDAQYIFERLISIMQIDAWELQLIFYSNKPTKFAEGITATPSDKLKGSWKSSSGRYVDNGLGNKEIWIELDELNDTTSLIATMAHELAHYKLLGEDRIEENDEHLTDLLTIAFGFGIFKGNSYFKFSQWTGTSHQGWQMNKKGYLPEQVIAYAMAWLAHYRNEDISWKQYFNKTMLKYFEQSVEHIQEHKTSMKWPDGSVNPM
jgi:DNA-directed RNA polymerase subunit RPC12/RpoP